MNGPVELPDTVYLRHFTVNGANVMVNADSTPTVEVFEDGVSIGVAGSTVSNPATGEYAISLVVSSGNGYEEGKRYYVVLTAIVSGITNKALIAEFVVKTGTTVTGFNTGVIDASSIASDAIAEIQSGLATAASLSALAAQILRVLALLHDNAMLDNHAYDGDGNLTSVRLRGFADATALAAATPGAANNADSETVRYTVTATWSGPGMQDSFEFQRSL